MKIPDFCNLDLINKVKQSLVSEDYELVIADLLKALGDENQDLYLWYLGLAYFLDNQQEESQNIWQDLITKNNISQQKIISFLENLCFEWIENYHLKNIPQLINLIYIFDTNYQNLFIDIAFNQALSTLYQTGIEFACNQDYLEAEKKFKTILTVIDDELTWHNLANLYIEWRKINLAKEAIQKALNLNINSANYHYTLAFILEKQGQKLSAIDHYKQAIILDKSYADSYNNLGNIYRYYNNIEQAIKIFSEALQFCPEHPGAYINLGNIYLDHKNYLAAEQLYKKAIKYNLDQIEIYDGLVQTLVQLGKNQEVLELLQIAIQKFPTSLFLQRKFLLFLPAIYETPEEILEYRERFKQGLERLIKQVELKTPGGIIHSYEIINGKSKTGQTNFYLAYQGYNDLALQKKYGQLVHDIMTAVYPQWVKLGDWVTYSNNRKIKIGYISQRMQSLLARLLIGWITNADKNKFEIHSYYIGDVIEPDNQYFQVFSDYYYHLPNQIEETVSQILQDKIDILVYFEIGLDPLISQLANLRLAPIQCATWGHPMTTGFPTIDYFLGSDAMEPANAQEHYSEKLIRLPKLGFNIERPPYLKPTKKRHDFGLNDNNILYLSCQALYKYLPQYDYVFPEIYRQVDHAKIIFINRPGSETITQKFKTRLKNIFEKYYLDYNQACCFLNGMPTPDYFSLIMLSDVFLDTIGFSGGFTSLDAIACGLPIVTLPTELMRGRQSYGMLNIINLTETIAWNEQEYVKIAIKLGMEPQWRQEIAQKIKSNANLLFNDLTCIQALEHFYFKVAKTKMEDQL